MLPILIVREMRVQALRGSQKEGVSLLDACTGSSQWFAGIWFTPILEANFQSDDSDVWFPVAMVDFGISFVVSVVFCEVFFFCSIKKTTTRSSQKWALILVSWIWNVRGQTLRTNKHILRTIQGNFKKTSSFRTNFYRLKSKLSLRYNGIFLIELGCRWQVNTAGTTNVCCRYIENTKILTSPFFQNFLLFTFFRILFPVWQVRFLSLLRGWRQRIWPPSFCWTKRRVSQESHFQRKMKGNGDAFPAVPVHVQKEELFVLKMKDRPARRMCGIVSYWSCCSDALALH